jgi:cytochrome c-type biogenesis protein CcmH/NrfG
MDLDRVDAAVRELRAAERLRPTSAELRLLLATALRRGGDADAVLEEFREATRLAPDGPLGEIARQEARHLARDDGGQREPSATGARR